MPARTRPERRAIGGIALLSCIVNLAALGLTPVAAGAPPIPPLSSVVISDLGGGLGPGYTVIAQGPLNPSAFAADAPDPSAASGALDRLPKTVSTYDRAWEADNGRNQVQDLLVRFGTASGAVVFEQTARQSLDRGEILQSGLLPSVPGAERVTYFPTADESGVGEAITMRSGVYVALLSFFSAASEKTQAITPAGAERVALAQHRAMGDAPGGPATGAGGSTAASAKKGGTSSSSIGWAVLAVAVLMVAVATPLLLRRRRDRANAQRAVPNG